MSPEQINDVLDCGNPERVWTTVVAYLETRARQSEDIAESLRRDAQDALGQADTHFAEAQEFHNLALAMKRAPVTFAASGMEAGTVETAGLDPEDDGPTLEEGDAQHE